MKKLFELRKKENFTQSQMAKILNVSQQAYARYEKGEREPDFDTLIRIADYFGVSIDYLLGRTNEKETTPANSVIEHRTFDIKDDEKALIITLRRSGNGSAYIRAILTMLGETRKAEEILSENLL